MEVISRLKLHVAFACVNAVCPRGALPRASTTTDSARRKLLFSDLVAVDNLKFLRSLVTCVASRTLNALSTTNFYSEQRPIFGNIFRRWKRTSIASILITLKNTMHVRYLRITVRLPSINRSRLSIHSCEIRRNRDTWNIRGSIRVVIFSGRNKSLSEQDVIKLFCW